MAPLPGKRIFDALQTLSIVKHSNVQNMAYRIYIIQVTKDNHIKPLWSFYSQLYFSYSFVFVVIEILNFLTKRFFPDSAVFYFKYFRTLAEIR